jgi:chaperonin GroEL (HSP60 family)
MQHASKVKEQSTKSAMEVASMILGIDDVIATTKPKGRGNARRPRQKRKRSSKSTSV